MCVRTHVVPRLALLLLIFILFVLSLSRCCCCCWFCPFSCVLVPVSLCDSYPLSVYVSRCRLCVLLLVSVVVACLSPWCGSLDCWCLSSRCFRVSRLRASSVHDCVAQDLLCTVDKKTGEKSATKPRFVKSGQAFIARLSAARAVCMEKFRDFPQFGRFTLRDEGACATRACAARMLTRLPRIHARRQDDRRRQDPEADLVSRARTRVSPSAVCIACTAVLCDLGWRCVYSVLNKYGDA